jgi:hypothetical protein
LPKERLFIINIHPSLGSVHPKNRRVHIGFMTDKIRQARVKGLLRVRLMREPIEPLKPVGLTVQCGGESELVRSLRESVEIPGWKIEA